MKQEKHVLVIFPHPDDEAFGVSGSISSYIDAGIPVTYACLTLGEMGRNLGNPPFATRESLPEIRRKELEEAAKVMEQIFEWGCAIKQLNSSNLKMKQMVLDLLAELQPSLVISFYPGYAVHPDHDATGEAVVAALNELDPTTRPVFYAVAFSNNHENDIGPADIIHDVSNYATRKLDTLRAHASQLAWTLPSMEKAYHEGVPEAVERLTKERFWTYYSSDLERN
ncbi:LOW QUALITY PROTEIN: LmbE family protein [Bacillus sp. JCM 19046]|nr:LOW QUALITY PROTEIN: LmbE family protein [Bacillus sp. JCM 19046]